MRLGICSLFPLASTCAASPVNLYIASYSGGAWAGNLTTLSLIQDSNSAFSLQQTSTLNTSTNSPSWLTLDRQKGILYLIDEAVNGTNGTIVAYKKNSNGQLAELGRQKTLPGGVSATLFGVGGLAVAEYGSGFLQTFDVTSPENISLVQTWAFNSRREFVKGIITDRQAAPHPHQVILDPSGEHLFVPDLGADAIHIFSVAKNSSLKLTRQMPSEKMKPGTGPRHIAFVPGTAGNFRLYLVGELDGTVAAYHSEKLQVSGKPWVKLHLIARYDTLKPGVSFPPIRDGAAKVAVAEIAVTPDHSTVIVSNRNDTSFGLKPPTDSIASFAIDSSDGTLTKNKLVSAHGSFPRQFALNRAGNLLAVGLQDSGNIVILKKHESSGLFEEEVASIQLPHGLDIPVCIAWDD